jgi:glutaconate CoA-transferase subunit A
MGLKMHKHDNKVMSLKEAVERFVHDGDEISTGTHGNSLSIGLISEVIRQKKRDLTLYSQSGAIDVELLVGAGCVSRLVGTYIWNTNRTSNAARALKNKAFEFEEYTNFQFNARLIAGARGFTFATVLESVIASDIFKKRGFLGESKFKVIKCPYTGKDILTVPAANPDVCILHVQRADKSGNAQFWGGFSSVQSAALASKRIIVSCEEIVDHEVIRSSPHNTIVPSYRTDAVIEMPFGGLPTQVVGYYYLDGPFYGLVNRARLTDEGFQKFLNEWVYGCEDHDAFLQKYIEIFGLKRLDAIKAESYFSTPVNYGGPYSSEWDEMGYHRALGIKFEDIERIMEEEGLYHE